MKRIISLLLAVVTTAALAFSAVAAMSGDINGDDVFDNKDVVALFRYVSGNTSEAIKESCDFNGDKKINNKDVTAIFRELSYRQSQTATVIDFGEYDVTLDCFKKTSYCTVEFEDDADEGRVVCIKTKNIVSSNVAPYANFVYTAYCKAIGEKAADFTQRPFIVLKVKPVDLHDRMFKITGIKTENGTALESNSASKRIPGGDGWKYICFDLSGAKNLADFKVFRLNFEALAGKSGECILISELRFCTAEEAAEYAAADVYTVEEQTVDDYKLKLMQFNVQTENGNGAPFITRSEMYRKLVDELQPDVVGMQEVTVSWRNWLDTYVFNDSYASVGVPRSTKAEEGLEANPIYYRKDKFDLIDSGTFWLSDTPDVVGSMYEDSNYPRICTWAVLRDKSTGTEFVHMNTHLDHNGTNKDTGNDRRKRQLGVIIKFAQRFDQSMPMFLTGDLNNRRTTSENKTYALIKMIQGQTQYTDAEGNKYSIALSDARLKAPGTDTVNTATMTKYYDESNSAYNPSYEPIDYVFYNDECMDALTYNTYLISENGAWISDHLPLFTTFRINRR